MTSRGPNTIPKIVLTGGPCSGKTSGMTYLTEKLSDYGFTVFVVPETATMITNTGIDRRRMSSPEHIIAYEEAILDAQLFLEEKIEGFVKRIFPYRQPVILLDRGIMDIKAFLPKGYDGRFNRILKGRGLTTVKARDRYTAVIHLVTAAEGAEEFYTLENNAARLESPEAAREADRKIRSAWLGHPHLKIIDNETLFETKIKKVFTVISRLLGVPVPTETVRRFLIGEVHLPSLPPHETIEIEQMYIRLKRPREEVRVRKRGQKGSYLYFTTKKASGGIEGKNVEYEHLITEEEYLAMVRIKDPASFVLKKERRCFLWENQYWKLDIYDRDHQGLMILKVELTEGNETIELPPFLKVQKEITKSTMYSDRNIARKKPLLL